MICIKCGKTRKPGRRMCSGCYKAYKREYAKDRYKKHGRYMYTKTCTRCKKEYRAYRKSQQYCSDCWKNRGPTNDIYANNNYLYTKTGLPQHRDIAQRILGRKLNTNEVVHHLDGNPKNNDLSNLIVLSRAKHTSLHRFLELQRVTLEQSNDEKDVNCWNSLIAPMTTTWLETTSVKVKKLWEIGQSAAKPLESGEGSETRHVPSHADDGIVQTTTG